MSGLPGQQPIQLPCHLPDQDALQIAPGGWRKRESVYFLEHALNRQDGWLDVIETVDREKIAAELAKEIDEKMGIKPDATTASK